MAEEKKLAVEEKKLTPRQRRLAAFEKQIGRKVQPVKGKAAHGKK